MNIRDFISEVSDTVGRDIPVHMAHVLIRREILTDVARAGNQLNFHQSHFDTAVDYFQEPRANDWPKLKKG